MARPTAGPGPLARVRARGSPSEGGGLVPSCFGIWSPYFVGSTTHIWSQGPRAFCLGWGAISVPPHRLFFHTRLFLFPAPGFFFCFFFEREMALGAPRGVPAAT